MTEIQTRLDVPLVNPRYAAEQRPEETDPMPQTTQAEPLLADAIVLFGATGDLSRRMLLPSLYFLDADGLLPVGFRILATARAQHSREEFVDQVREILDARPEPVDAGVWTRFCGRIDYVACDAT